MVALNFNARNVAPNTMPEPLPSGTYDVIIQASPEKPTKNRDGFFTEITMVVQGGEYNGRKIIDRLNLKNKNDQAMEIAYGTLSAICHVTGRLEIQQTEQLHGIPFKIVVEKVPRDDRPGAYSNNVTGYKDINGNDPGMGGGAGAQQSAAPSWAGGAQNSGGQQQMHQQGGPQQMQDPNAGNWQGNNQQQNNGNFQQQGNQQQQFDPNAGNNFQQGGQQQMQHDPNAGAWQGNGGGQQMQQNNGQQQFQQNNGQQFNQQNNGGPQFQNQNNGGQTYPAQQQNPNMQGNGGTAGDAPPWVG